MKDKVDKLDSSEGYEDELSEKEFMEKHPQFATEMKKEDLIVAFQESMCNITTACKKIGISRSTYYNWLEKDKIFRTNIMVALMKEEDYVEDKLKELIEKGNITAITFWLKYKHSDYKENRPVSHQLLSRYLASSSEKEGKEFLDKLDKEIERRNS